MDNGKPDRNKMTVDERLEYLLKSTESLHDQIAELVETGRKHEERMERVEARDRKHRRAVLKAMTAYLEELGSDEP